MARILFFTANAMGHISPAVLLAKKLVERGHEVYWYNSPRFRDKIEASGAKFMPYKTAQDYEWEKIDELFPERSQLKGMAQFKWDMKKTLEIALDQYQDVADILSEIPVDVILGDVIMFSPQCVSEIMGLPYVYYSPIPLMILSHDVPPPGTPFGPNATSLGRIRNRLLNGLVFRVFLRGIDREVNQFRATLGLPPSDYSFMEMETRQSDLHLQTTIPAFEFPRSDLPDHVHFIGALLPEPSTEFTEPSWWHELNDDRPVILVTQGTVATHLDDLLNPTIAGLADENMLVVGTLSNKSVDEVKPNPLPENVRLEPFIPFAHLLPYVDVMVTNGGYGGVHFALAHGVPLVVAGQSEDKVEVNLRVGWSGVGINLKTSRPTPKQVREAVKEVLRTEQYKGRAQAMQRDIAKFDSATKGAELIEELVATKQRDSQTV